MDEEEREHLQTALGLYADLQGITPIERPDPSLSAGTGGMLAAYGFVQNASPCFDRVAAVVEDVANRVLREAEWPAELNLLNTTESIVFDPAQEVYRLLEAYRILTLRMATLCCDIIANL
ncbi:MAG TPA: hypothetical protein EYP17_09860 [Candidatus Latescibacteria bacterium]|nr:hypothetical protein [Candidatus Latescibacterota bacterium]